MAFVIKLRTQTQREVYSEVRRREETTALPSKNNLSWVFSIANLREAYVGWKNSNIMGYLWSERTDRLKRR